MICDADGALTRVEEWEVWWNLTREAHPDRVIAAAAASGGGGGGGGDGGESESSSSHHVDTAAANERFRKVREAFEALRNKLSRRPHPGRR